MLNIGKYGNTTNGTIPLCLWDYENDLKEMIILYLPHLVEDLLGALFI